MKALFNTVEDSEFYLEVSTNFNRKLFDKIGKNVFCFISEKDYRKISPSVKTGSVSSEDDLTLEEIMQEKIFYVIMDDVSRMEKIEFIVKAFKAYSKKSLTYVMLVKTEE